MRKLFEHLARERPIVVVIDDIHWAEPLFLDLIENLADWTRDAMVLILCVAATGAARDPAGLGRRQDECDGDPARTSRRG